jgi:hypothetical protein
MFEPLHLATSERIYPSNKGFYIVIISSIINELRKFFILVIVRSIYNYNNSIILIFMFTVIVHMV